MIKKIKIQFIFILGSLFFMNSCAEDEGNYEYIEINEVAFKGIPESNTVLRGENLTINTDDVEFTLDPDGSGTYEYSWEAVSKNPLKDEIYKLSSDKNIDAQITLIPDNYTVYYIIKDLNTEVAWQHNVDLYVTNSIYEGWMVLNDVGGESRLDMVSLLDGEYKEIQDVLGFVGSPLVLSGKPGFVKCYEWDRSFYGIYVSTEGNGTTKLEPDTFEWQKEYNLSYEFVGSQPENLEVDYMHIRGRNESVVMKDNDFYHYRSRGPILYNIPLNVTNQGVRFDVSKYYAKGSSFGSMMFYDDTNKKFMQHVAGRTYCFELPPSTEDLVAPGKDLIYMKETSYGGGFGENISAILKDPVDGKNHIGFFSVGWSGLNVSHYSEITATDFDLAENIAIDPTYAYIMYNVGGKVYEYDIFTSTTVEMLDKGSQKISTLKYHTFDIWSPSYWKMGKQLIVCSYDPAGTEGSNGTIEFYDVFGIQGQIQLDTSYTGFGKVVSLSYRERY